MIYTARQLDQLHRAGGNGQLVLPYGARLTPLAVDWARQRKVRIGYSDIEAPAVDGKTVEMTDAWPQKIGQTALFWWCDASCGAAKAALAAVGRDGPLELREIGVDPRRGSEVARLLSREIGSGVASAGCCAACRANKGDAPAYREGGVSPLSAPPYREGGVSPLSAALGVIFVQNAAAMMIYLNRCRSLRAVLGTTLRAVDVAVTALAANVLVIEYPDKSLPQMRNLLGRFVKGSRKVSDELARDLVELSACE